MTAPRRAAVPARPISPPRNSRQLAFLSNHLRFVASAPHPAPPRRGLPPPTHVRILCLAERPHSPTPPAPPSGHHSSGHARQFRAMTTAIKRRLPYCQGGEVRPLLAAPRSIRLSPPAQTGTYLGCRHSLHDKCESKFLSSQPGSKVRTPLVFSF